MTESINLGFPRIGAHRELKRALEQYWSKTITAAQLLDAATELRKKHWLQQKEAGINRIPSNDFSFYDQVLDMVQLFSAIPERYKGIASPDSLEVYFAMARGISTEEATIPAMEMTKWFDTNYHYIVPEFDKNTKFALQPQKVIQEWKEAKALGIDSHTVLLGPVSFLALGKGADRFNLLPSLVEQYNALFTQLEAAGVSRVQLDEPVLVLDRKPELEAAFKTAYASLVPRSIELLIATYFDSALHNTDLIASLPVHAIHLDCSKHNYSVEELRPLVEHNKKLSLGLICGRNIWRADLDACLNRLETYVAAFGKDALMVGPSCSLLHTPVDCSTETQFDSEFLSWLSFARQKLDEIATLSQGISMGRASIAEQLKENKAIIESRKTSTRIHRPAVKTAAGAITADMCKRDASYTERRTVQDSAIPLPLFPTTTIGSYPQTKSIRKLRAEYRKNIISAEEYNTQLKQEIKYCIEFQERIGLDVLVHGEAERNDMVEYFGEQLEGFTVSTNGWVQSYGSRCVKPPIIFGDLERKHAMTVDWISYAQSLSKSPVKGMLTGPVTILQWSFVRDDQPDKETTMQIALAIRQEVSDLEKAGISIIQVDEPAFREGMPLQSKDRADYIDWASAAFRLATSAVQTQTQIHTHMCYCEFNDSIQAIAKLDADVISLESSRSNMEILDIFSEYHYPNSIGPGVYDIHSPNVPTKDEMLTLLKKALEVLKPEQLWVNPDCGLKTRKWEEVEPSLQNMVSAAKELRSQYKG